jgi:hypothetical protein
VADQVRALQAHGLHPDREPGRGLGEDEAAVEAAHGPEAGEVEEVETVALREDRDVAGPPAGGARETVHEDDGLTPPRYLLTD